MKTAPSPSTSGVQGPPPEPKKLKVIKPLISESNESDQSKSEVSESEQDSDEAEQLKKKVRLDQCKTRTIRENGVKRKVTSYSKYQACYYCDKLVSKISKHLPSHHKKEPEVVEMMALPLKSKERRQKCKLLTNWGNYKHNRQVLRRGKGKIIVAKRPSPGQEVSFFRFYPCSHCLAFINRSELWRHVKECTFRKPGEKMASAESLERSKALLIQATIDDPRLIKILTKIKKGPVLNVIQEDRLIKGKTNKFSTY